MVSKITASEIEERFEEAARTLRRLPDPAKGPKGYGSSWPPIIRSYWEAYGADPARPPCISPSPEAISRMEETFDWLLWIEPDDARIVWLRAEGVRWRQVCNRVGLSRSAAWRRWVAALVMIANRCNSRDFQKGQKFRRNGITATLDRARSDGVF
jgi:hypothetical protein